MSKIRIVERKKELAGGGEIIDYYLQFRSLFFFWFDYQEQDSHQQWEVPYYGSLSVAETKKKKLEDDHLTYKNNRVKRVKRRIL